MFRSAPRYGSIFLAAGLILLLASEFAGIGSVRLLAAVLLAAGAAAIGVAAGLKSWQVEIPARIAVVAARATACLAAAVLTAPAAVLFAFSLAASVSRLVYSDSVLPLAAIASGLAALLMLAALAAAFALAIGAIRGKSRSPKSPRDA